MADQSDQINTNAQKPATVTADSVTTVQHPIESQILADQYAAAAAGVKKKYRGLRFNKLINPGAASDQGGSQTGSVPSFSSGGG